MEGQSNLSVVWVKGDILDAASAYASGQTEEQATKSSRQLFRGGSAEGEPQKWGWTRVKVISGSVEELAAAADNDGAKNKSNQDADKQDPNSSSVSLIVSVIDSDSIHDGKDLEILPKWFYAQSAGPAPPSRPPPQSSGSSLRNIGGKFGNSLASSAGKLSRAASVGSGVGGGGSDGVKKKKSPNILAANKIEANDVIDDDGDRISAPDDLIELTHLHEPALVYSLRERFFHDKIYTFTGQILLALNPFKYIEEAYESDTMNKYRKQGMGIDHGESLPPHVYSTADASFRAMLRGLELVRDTNPATSAAGSGSNKKNARKKFLKKGNASGGNSASGAPPINQSVLVSGESGAGKTVTTKHIMAYLASGSSRSSKLHMSRGSIEGPRKGTRKSRRSTFNAGAMVEQKVLDSNPILEAFGNARTVRNDNSSRFGKYIELQFSSTGKLVGASIDTYLLERVRLVHQMPNERNYHIFYQMMISCTEDEREKYKLWEYDVTDFKMTSMSECFERRDNVDEEEEFDYMVQSLGTMGFTDEDQEDVFKIVAAVLHSSNLTFDALSDDECCINSEDMHAHAFTDLLGFTYANLNSALCYFEIQVGKEKHKRSLPLPKAEKGLEALIKSLYSALFDYLVQRINESIVPKTSGKTTLEKAASIGILDIFGFESFKINSFEQLCINYCNEALQQQFNQFVFKSEQEDYKKEGINWSFIEFPDNQDVLDLIDGKSTGIIAVLDDKARIPKSTDAMFADALYQACKDSSRFEATMRQQGAKKFGVHHYAGTVEYETDGFLEKNKDELPKEASELLLSSTNSFVKTLEKIISAGQGGGSNASNRRGPKRIKSVGNQFTAQLRSLMTRINETSPHFVRCLKPNSQLVPDVFDTMMIADQLKYAGVLEAVRVSRVGFPQRYGHKAFAQRYRVVGVNVKGFQTMDVAGQCKAIIDVILEKISKESGGKLDDEQKHGIQVGKTKIFLKQQAFEELERVRLRIMSVSVLKVQTATRRWLCMIRYKRLVSAIRVQSSIRMFVCRSQLKKSISAVIKIQSAVRLFEATKKVDALRRNRAMVLIAMWVQKVQRGRVARRDFREKLEIKRQKEEKDAQFIARKAAAEREEAVAREKALKEEAAAREAVLARQVEAEKNTLSKEVERLNQSLEEANAEKVVTALKVDELTAQVAKLEDQLAKKSEEQAKSVSRALVAASAREAELKRQVEAAAEERNKLTEEIEKLSKSIDEVEAEKGMQVAMLEAQLEEMVDHKEKLIAEQERSNSVLRQAEKDIEEAISREKVLKEEATLHEEELTHEVGTLQQSLAEVSARRDSAVSKVDSFSSRVTEYEAKLAEKDALKEEIDARVAELERRVETEKEEKISLSNKVESLRQSLNEVTAAKDNAVAMTETLSRQIADLRTQLEESNVQQSRSIVRQDEEIEKAITREKELKEEAVARQAEYTRLIETEKIKSNKELETLKQSLTDLESEKSSALSRVDTLSLQVTELYTLLAEKDEELVRSESRHGKEREEAIAREAALKDETTRWQAELMQKLESETTQLKNLSVEIGRMHESLEIVTAEKDEAAIKAKTWNEQAIKLEAQLKVKKDELASSIARESEEREKAAARDNALKEQSAEREAELARQIEAEKKERDDMNKELEVLKNNLEEVGTEKVNALLIVESLRSQVSELQNKLIESSEERVMSMAEQQLRERKDAAAHEAAIQEVASREKQEQKRLSKELERVSGYLDEVTNERNDAKVKAETLERKVARLEGQLSEIGASRNNNYEEMYHTLLKEMKELKESQPTVVSDRSFDAGGTRTPSKRPLMDCKKLRPFFQSFLANLSDPM